jgi:hypothetical protein
MWFRGISPLAAVLLIAASVSCSRGADRAANDTGTSDDSLRADTAEPAPPFREWNVAAGRHLLIATAADSAVIVFPEFTIDSSLTGASFALGVGASREYELFAPDGSTTIGRLAGVATASQAGCDAWPRATVTTAAARTWTLGLEPGRAKPIPYTALNLLPARDSTNIAVSLTRLASQAPNDTSVRFRGLPYVVRSGYTAILADSQSFIFGELVRRLNVEASPHEERTTVIGEKSAAAPDAPFTLAFSERHVGDEESVPTTELLGLVRLRNGTHAAFATRDYSDGGTYLMFERAGSGEWRLRWHSAYAGC